jgi:translation initiation factor 2 alpha subunit (eIF-2alpha)
MVHLYSKKTPELNEVTLVKITDINKLNIVATLLDYDDIVGYISYSELSKKKRYKLHKIVTIGKEVVVQVSGFNKEKNYAELSIRSLIASEITEFNNNRQSYLKLYNLWRIVYMKLNPIFDMDFTKVVPDEINNFMKNTLWTIESSVEQELEDEIINEKYSYESIYNILLNPSKNMEILKYLSDCDISQIKSILDTYSQIKSIPIKQIKHGEFTAYSYELDGLSNLKNAFNYKSFEKFSELNELYDISILYLTGNKYSLTIKQKIPMNEDILEKYDYLIQEIKSRCENNKIIISI